MQPHRVARKASWLLITTLAIGLPSTVGAQPRDLTLDNIFGPTRVNFDGYFPRVLTWIDEDHFLQSAETRPDGPILRVDVLTGETEPLFDSGLMQSALRESLELSAPDAGQLVWSAEYLLNATQTAVVIDHDNDLYYYELGSREARRLTGSPEAETEVSFSPDGTMVAYVRDHNLMVVDVDGSHERALTNDGSLTIRNGILDWVYQEEIYGRGNFRGYWWSPDSTHLAYLRLDDSLVPIHPILGYLPYHPQSEEWPYPKAGDPNPVGWLGVVSASGGNTTWVTLNENGADELLIVNVEWSGDGSQIAYQIQNREQTWLNLNLADVTGNTIHLFREESDTWVNVSGPPSWLADGSFVWRSERSGWMHLYHYNADGTLRRQITDGPWEVRELHGIDEDTGWVYFSGTERSPIGGDVYRVQLDGSERTRLSDMPGTHHAHFSPNLSRYLDTVSTISTPSRLYLFAADGTRIRTVDENHVPALADFDLSEPEFLQVPTRDGFIMEALMLKPPDFDPSRKYPVYQHVYGGPHLQRVRDRWTGSTFMFWQLLAQHEVIVWVLDNRTASGKGAISTWPVYKNFGELELRDIEDGVAWLREQPYVDATRIGIEGWSYGGFMVSYALTHSRSFAMGIAGGSVTDWRNYDTIYTERYMQRPQDNQAGYTKSSPRFNAANLNGALLLIHGAMDENVHVQNTLQFADALQQAGKPFEMMIYPQSRHRLGSLTLERHRHALMLKFTLRHLNPD